jgi:hypothetical protein
MEPEEKREAEAQSKLSTLAFISLNENAKDTFRGGILVTDVRGKPIEFRCTSAIQPNAVQKTLYGSTLWPYMAVELMGLPLIRSVVERPHVIIIQQPEFIDVRSAVEQPVLLLSRQGSTLAVAEDGNQAPTELINSPSGKFEPIVVTSHEGYGSDLEIVRDLRERCTAMDLMEPFERIRKAIEFVHQKESKTPKP